VCVCGGATPAFPPLPSPTSLLVFMKRMLRAQGGMALSLVQGKPIMESAHFTSAMAGFALLATQAALTTTFKGASGQTGRTAHAFLGSATMSPPPPLSY